MIKVKRIIPFTCEWFDPNGISIGFLNDFEFNDLRIQVRNGQVSGYYAIYNKTKIEMTRNGRCTVWLDGFYDMFDKQLSELL